MLPAEAGKSPLNKASIVERFLIPFGEDKVIPMQMFYMGSMCYQ
jgi:hypothetical protein